MRGLLNFRSRFLLLRLADASARKREKRVLSVLHDAAIVVAEQHFYPVQKFSIGNTEGPNGLQSVDDFVGIGRREHL